MAEPLRAAAGPGGGDGRAFPVPQWDGVEPGRRPGREDAGQPAGGSRQGQAQGAQAEDSRPAVPLLSLAFHEASGRWMAVYKDPRTGEVLKTVPPEELLDAVGRIRQVLGLFLDTYR